MLYKINIVPNGVTVDRMSDREARKISLIMALTAFVIAVAGFIWLALSNFESENSIPYIAAGFGSLLAVGCLIHAMIAGQLLRHLPEQVFFNNDRAIVEIKHKASRAGKIEIPYQHVVTIDSRTISVWDSTSKRNRVRYAVTLYLKDGSSWDLMEDAILDQSYASDYAGKIKNNTSLGKITTEKIIQPKLDTRKLSVVHRGDETQIRWRNNNPANMLRKLGIPIIIIVLASFMSVMGEARDWGFFMDALKTNVHTFSDLAKIPELLGGLVFSTGIIFICFVVLLAQVIRILLFRLKDNKIIINKNEIISDRSNLPIPIKSAGTTSITYHIGHGSRDVEVLRHAPTFTRAESTTFEGDIDFKTVMGMMGESFKEGVKEAAQDIFTNKDDATTELSNPLLVFSFDRFSPVDVYVVKESIRQKLNTAVSER